MLCGVWCGVCSGSCCGVRCDVCCGVCAPERPKAPNRKRKETLSVQLFNLISFLESPGLDSELLALPGLDSWLPSRCQGESREPKEKQTLQSVQLFNLISFLKPPGLDSGLLALPGLDSCSQVMRRVL